VVGAANIVLDGFTITNGMQSGLWIENAPASALFQNLKITNNEMTGTGGGGIYVTGGAPELNYLTVTGNSSIDGWGGGIYLKETAAIVTNVFASSNTTDDAGGGIAIAGGAPRLENIIVTDNQADWAGGGIYNHGNPVIVNAVVSGNFNTCLWEGDSNGSGGAIYTTVGNPVIVNALVSGNKSVSSTGGGGIKVLDGTLTLINSTVSGNYTVNMSNQPQTGGGLKVVNTNGGGVAEVYNSLVLGNTGNGVAAGNDVATGSGGQIIAYNSLFGGWTKAQMDATGGNSNNADGTNYGYGAAHRLVDLEKFFETFSALPDTDNTGRGKAADWNGGSWADFHLDGGAVGAVNGGNADYLVQGFSGLPYRIAKDLDGDERVQNGDPDMGAYESPWTGLSGNGNGN
jgi:hypothetical protein